MRVREFKFRNIYFHFYKKKKIFKTKLFLNKKKKIKFFYRADNLVEVKHIKMKFILIAIALLQINQLINCDETNIKFSFQNCGPATDPFIVQALSVAPDPIHFPGNVTVTAAVSLAKDITSPVQV